MIDGVALTYEHRSPAGVFALISPWNMPLYLLTWKIAPCLAFGCTAVAKPSEVTSMSAFLLCEVFRQAGLPSGVINVVFGDGPTTGSALVKSPLVKGVSFTGGTATGIQIRKDTADQIYKHLSLELGGKNPTLVFDDVDLTKAVETAAMAAFENQGEVCAEQIARSCDINLTHFRSASVAHASTYNQASMIALSRLLLPT
jgi:aminomuconate-semialdehyde dehydrogenase